MKVKLFLSFMAACLAQASAANAGVLYDFNDPAQLSDFTHRGGTSAWTHSSSGGIGGTGGLTAGSPNNTSIYLHNQGFAGNTSSFTLGMSFQWAAPTYGTGHGFMVGVLPSLDSDLLRSSAGQEQFYFGIGRVGMDNTARIIGNYATGTEYLDMQSPEKLTLDPGSWYNISGNISFSEDTKKFVVAVTLASVNPENGVLTTLSTYSFTTPTLAGLAADNDVYAFFGSYATATGRGTAAIDNFYTTIPEPGTYAFLGISGAALLLARRKRSIPQI